MIPTVPPASHDRLITVHQVAQRLAISRRTLYRHVARGLVPPPVERRRGALAHWRESDIDAHIARLSAAN